MRKGAKATQVGNNLEGRNEVEQRAKRNEEPRGRLGSLEKEEEGSNERDERKRKRGEEKKPASAKLQEGSTREGSLNSNDI